MSLQELFECQIKMQSWHLCCRVLVARGCDDVMDTCDGDMDVMETCDDRAGALGVLTDHAASCVAGGDDRGRGGGRSLAVASTWRVARLRRRLERGHSPLQLCLHL